MSTTTAAAGKSEKRANAAELSLAAYLQTIESRFPQDVIHVTKPVEPSKFEVSALLKHLENRGKFPLLVFDNPRDVNGGASSLPLLSNIYATRERCAVAMGLE